MKTPRKITILLHHNDSIGSNGKGIIWVLMQAWLDWGIKVEVVRGTERRIDTDIVFPQIPLTTIPEEYVQFLSEYPCVVNQKVLDISKRSFSTQLVGRDDDYAGPVIVKTDRNFGGHTELNLVERTKPVLYSRIASLYDRCMRQIAPNRALIRAKVLDPFHYPIFPSADSLPNKIFDNQALVVERFMPEMQHGKYFLRNYVFLGDQHINSRKRADCPVVKASVVNQRTVVPVADEIVAIRKRLGFDYGKFDYVVRDGQAILFDVNNTPTFAAKNKQRTENLDRLARGIYALF